MTDRTHQSSSRQSDKTPRPTDRHHGGQEPPDNVQDRPEQNAGYDAAVRGDSGSPVPLHDDAEVVDVWPGAHDSELEVDEGEEG